MLKTIKHPTDVGLLSPEEQIALASEIRNTIIEVVASNGGHLAPSLGVVELTIALLNVFNPDHDKIVWDVGHQCYPWKLLTGRYDNFHTLRCYEGISGFPRRSESKYDQFGVGHASTSLSAALGMAMAREISGGDEHVVTVIGDGALTGGMAFEALNHAGALNKRFVVILNDNNMSISRNVGALSLFLSRNLSNSGMMRVKYAVARLLSSIPDVGRDVLASLRRGEASFKTFFTSGMLFEALNFNYIGPVDGHNIPQLVRHLQAIKELEMPVLLHVRTQKGRGYAPAEQNPSHFHGVSAFVPGTGLAAQPLPDNEPSGPGYSKALGQALCELGAVNPNLVVITAAMPDGTGTAPFQQKYPQRFVDVGICEEHAVTFAAGLASQGMQPVVAVYSTFMQRAYDQIIHDVCLQDLPVVLCLDRAGLVGEDGPTHHGAFDLSWLRCVPNLHLIAPRDERELRNALHTALQLRKPVAIRYPRGKSLSLSKYLAQPEPDAAKTDFEELPIGQGEFLLPARGGLCLISVGQTAYACMEAAGLLEQKTVHRPAVFDARWVKPLPREQLLQIVRDFDQLLIVEENALAGGFSSAVLELLADQQVLGQVQISRIGLPDYFVPHGQTDKLRKLVGLDSQTIAQRALDMIAKKDLSFRLIGSAHNPRAQTALHVPQQQRQAQGKAQIDAGHGNPDLKGAEGY